MKSSGTIRSLRHRRIWTARAAFGFMRRLAPDLPDYCKEGSGNPFAKNFPMPAGSVARGGVILRSQDGQIRTDRYLLVSPGIWYLPTTRMRRCITATPPASRGMGGIGWIKTRVWDETHDAEKSMGWCPAILDYNGDGKIGAYTKPDEPPDPKLDRAVGGAQWLRIRRQSSGRQRVVCAGLARPTKFPGKSSAWCPAQTRRQRARRKSTSRRLTIPNVRAWRLIRTLGIAIDTNGVVWAALAGSNDLASFDRSKCKGPLNGPTATGQHCPEGWTLYPVPGPKFKGTRSSGGPFLS